MRVRQLRLSPAPTVPWRRRLLRWAAVALAAAIGTALSVAPSWAASSPAPSLPAPAGGPIKVFITPGASGGAAIVVTGAIGGRGKAIYVNKDGQPSPKGNYVKVTMEQGTGEGSTFEGNVTAVNAKANTATFPIATAACTAEGTLSGPVTLLDGTGLYKGISGTVQITETIAWTMPRYASGAKKGQCDGPQAVQFVYIAGQGKVSF